MAIERMGQSADLSGTAALHVGERGSLQAFWRDEQGNNYRAIRELGATAIGRYIIELRPGSGGGELLGPEPAIFVVDVLP